MEQKDRLVCIRGTMSKSTKAKDTHQHIINKATLLFTKNGYNHTTLSQILNATGLAKGGFYFHFKSKEELGIAVIDSLNEYWHNELLPSLHKGKSAYEKLEIMLSATGDCYNSPDCIRPTILLLTLATEMIEVHDEFSKQLKNIFSEWLNTLECIINQGKSDGVFRADVDPGSVAAIIMSNIMGANLLALLNEEPCLYRKQLSSLKVILLNGIAVNQYDEVMNAAI